MYIELLVAALAVFVWVESAPGVINTLAYNAIFAASVVTVLFNANPLMRFDGYYILSDMLQIPNLAMKGQRMMQWFGKRFLLGMKDEVLPQAIRERRWIIGAYGIGAAIWKIVIWIGIMSIASSLFKGAGIVIVFAALMGAVVSTLKRFFRFLGSSQGRLKPRVALVRILVFTTAIVLPFVLIPISPSPKMATVVHHPEKAILRVECPGFVTQVLCRNGERVQKGDVLLVMDNQLKLSEYAQSEIDIRRSEIQAALWLDGGHVASHQAEMENLTGLKKRRDSIRELVQTLEFRAPRDGIVHGDHLEALPGTFLEAGEKVISILPAEPPELMVTIGEDDIDAVRRRRADGLTLQLKGHGGVVKGELVRLEARATTTLPHLALGAASGGPLPLRQRTSLQSDREKGLVLETPGIEGTGAGLGADPEDQALAGQELVRPRLIAHAKMVVDDDAIALNEGEWGYAKLTGGQRYRLGEWVVDKVTAWGKRQFDRARNVGGA